MKTTLSIEIKPEDSKVLYNKKLVNWNRSQEYNKFFIKAQEKFFNELLMKRGIVFLNEVYEALGIQRTSNGQVVGWKKGSDIIFNITEIGNNEYELDFNIDGIIIDLIENGKNEA